MSLWGCRILRSCLRILKQHHASKHSSLEHRKFEKRTSCLAPEEMAFVCICKKTTQGSIYKYLDSTLSHAHMLMHAHSHTHTHTLTHKLTHAHMATHASSHTHTCTQAHSRAHTQLTLTKERPVSPRQETDSTNCSRCMYPILLLFLVPSFKPPLRCKREGCEIGRGHLPDPDFGFTPE